MFGVRRKFLISSYDQSSSFIPKRTVNGLSRNILSSTWMSFVLMAFSYRRNCSVTSASTSGRLISIFPFLKILIKV